VIHAPGQKMGPVDQERVREQEIELCPSVGNDHAAAPSVGAHRGEQGVDGGEVVVVRPQPLAVGSAQGAHQVVDQPRRAALVAPRRAVEPPHVEAGQRHAFVDRLAACPELRDDAGGLDASPDLLRDELGGSVDVGLPGLRPRRRPASRERGADEEHTMDQVNGRRHCLECAG